MFRRMRRVRAPRRRTAHQSMGRHASRQNRAALCRRVVRAPSGLSSFSPADRGALRGRPFAFRDGFALWPSTYFLFVLSAAAVGPSFLALTSGLVEKITKKRLVSAAAYDKLGAISGRLLVVYILLKSIDTLVWVNQTSPSHGFPAHRFYQWSPFGTWMLLAEIAVFGLLPALILLQPSLRAKRAWLMSAAGLACVGVALNRFVLTIQTLAVPTLPFDKFLNYWPSWQEFGTFGAVLAFGVLVYSFSFR